jgi:adenine deaminase
MISGYVVDVVAKTIIKAKVEIESGKIKSIIPSENVDNQYIIPGFVDAHIHIESSMMLPAEFARYSVVHGTVACVCDPHEMANVCGVAGINYMIENSRQSPMKFFFGAPSCVPSTSFEAAGAHLDAHQVDELLQRDDIYFLAEMMNFPGVIHHNKQVWAKLEAAKRLGKPIDGHAPELKGADLEAYAAGGITTDHECMTIAEAEAKIALGMTVQIREGSAAKNFDDLLPLLEKYPDKIMFCSDDKHPDDLLKNGHINTLARRAVAAGFDPVDVLRICSYTPVKHYGLNVGLLQEGDDADFVVVTDLQSFDVQSTFIKGVRVSDGKSPLFERFVPDELINRFEALSIVVDDLYVKDSGGLLRVIDVEDGQLYTKEIRVKPKVEDGNLVSDVENDVLKMVVYNRYAPSKPAVGFIHGIGLKKGAMASTVAHDSHNIVAVGTSDAEICSAINKIIETEGGILATSNGDVKALELPVGGLLSDQPGSEIARLYEEVDAYAKELGTTLRAPFMTIAFMSLLVIPEIKLGDKGLFDGRSFQFISLQD